MYCLLLFFFYPEFHVNMAALMTEVCRTGKSDKITKSERKLKNKSPGEDVGVQQSPKKKLKRSDYSAIEFKVEIKDSNLTFQGTRDLSL